MSDADAPRIEFPCDYPIKVLGRSGDEFERVVLEIFERHAPGYSRETMTRRPSRNGRFTALTITIVATGKPQLEVLHQDLMATGLVQMVI